MLAALILTASLALPTTVADASSRSNEAPLVEKKKAAKKQQPQKLAQARLAPDPNSPDREPAFMDQYMPFTLSSQALPQVKDGLVLSHILGYFLPCGGLWGPVVLIDGAEFSGDVVLSWLLSSIIWTVAIAAVSFITFGVGAIAFLALPYLATTATLNAVDRGLKKKGYQAPEEKPNTTKTDPVQPPTTTDTPPPSYAY